MKISDEDDEDPENLLSLQSTKYKNMTEYEKTQVFYFGEQIRHTVLQGITDLCDPKTPKTSWWNAVNAPGEYEKGEIPYSRFV